LRMLSAWIPPLASERQVPTFLTKARIKITPPSCRTPVGQSAGFPNLARGTEVWVPVSTSLEYVSTPHQRFTCVRLLDPHLTESSSAFSFNVHHKALDLRSLWWFEVRSCKPTPRGRPSSLVKHRFRPQPRAIAFVAHNLFVLDASPQPLHKNVVHRPSRPSMLIVIPHSSSRFVKTSLVNCAP